jgi:hypothetical protein
LLPIVFNAVESASNPDSAIEKLPIVFLFGLRGYSSVDRQTQFQSALQCMCISQARLNVATIRRL